MESILDIYSSAVYEIHEPQMIFRVGSTSEKLDLLLAQHGERSWAFITPYNPYPDTLSAEENMRRLWELSHMTESYITYLGEGRWDDEHPCDPEKSLLILGISREEAERIGNHFNQKAILCGVIGGVIELVVLF
jgi:hypothetical protein